jgi:hypothetical protein
MHRTLLAHEVRTAENCRTCSERFAATSHLHEEVQAKRPQHTELLSGLKADSAHDPAAA